MTTPNNSIYSSAFRALALGLGHEQPTENFQCHSQWKAIDFLYWCAQLEMLTPEAHGYGPFGNYGQVHCCHPVLVYAPKQALPNEFNAWFSPKPETYVYFGGEWKMGWE